MNIKNEDSYQYMYTVLGDLVNVNLVSRISSVSICAYSRYKCLLFRNMWVYRPNYENLKEKYIDILRKLMLREVIDVFEWKELLSSAF